MQVKHLSNHEIDFNRWDETIHRSPTHLMYAMSWYLNVVSPEWEALVSENYEYVMPITVKRKYNLPYIVQPFFTQQLGIFSANPISEEIIKLFIEKIPYYSYEINLNESNHYNGAIQRINYILDLNKNYTEIKSLYSKNTKRNIAKAMKADLKVSDSVNVHDFFDLYKMLHGEITDIKFHFVEELVKRNAAKFYGAFNQNNVLVAAVCVFGNDNRITYLLPGSTTEGKELSAMFLIVDTIIQKECLKNKILDFEGSSIESIARFYKGFGAVIRPYFIMKKLRPSFLVGKI